MLVFFFSELILGTNQEIDRQFPHIDFNHFNHEIANCYSQNASWKNAGKSIMYEYYYVCLNNNISRCDLNGTNNFQECPIDFMAM